MDYISENFLSEYFMFEYVLGDYCNRKVIFSRLCEVYMLSPKKSRELFALTQNDDVKAVTTEKEYFRYCRVLNYSNAGGAERDLISEIIAIKGNALSVAGRAELKRGGENTESVVYKSLCSSAATGYLTALRILGILQCEGMFMPKNREAGVKNLEKAAKWNSIEGVLAAMCFDSDSVNLNARRLYALTVGTPFEPLFTAAKQKYGFECEEKALETELLEKAFGAGILKRDIFASKHARIIFSETLNLGDKEKIIYSTNEDIISECCNLPLKLKFCDTQADITAFSRLPLKRAGEQTKILQALENYDLRRETFYRPPCLCGESDYVVNMYAQGVENYFAGAHIQRIEAASLSDYDLEPVKNNIFIRSCNEEKFNVYLIVLKGDVKEKVITEIKNFLKSATREKFRLANPAIDVNLSAILPVCLCDNENLSKIYSLCDVINLSSVAKSEKSAAVQDMLKSKKRIYGVESLTIHKDAYEKLCACSMEAVESALDKGVRFSRKKGGKTVITCEQIKEYITATNVNGGYGFGGAYNEYK